MNAGLDARPVGTTLCGGGGGDGPGFRENFPTLNSDV